ncbi:hypothetical protein DL767_009755 [Monosporascus sp. MG133]|nr:hypothetical protein DL767_009755 [Monosporascus sp. MG133]
MDSSNHEASGSHETAMGGGIAQGTQDTATAQGGLSRLLRLRTAGIGSRHARKSSVDSLDRVFDTRTDSKDPRVVPLQRVLTAEEEHIAKNSCGVTELRDSFFDAVFLSPEEVDTDELLKRAEATLPYAFRKKDPLSVTNFLPKQWHEVQSVVQRVTTTRAGIKLLKSFLGFFVAYILCLIPQIQSWLGRYSHVMVVSAIINHSGRTLGAHVDGVIMTTFGQVIALVICAIVAPDAGARPLAVALHQAFGVMLDGLDVNGPDIVRTRRKLAQTFVNLSQAYRDLVIDFSITLFRPQDVRVLRNRTQGVVRTILSLKSGTRVFEVAEASDMNVTFRRRAGSDDFAVGIDKRSRTKEVAGEWEVMRFVAGALAEPTEDLLSAMRCALQSCDAVLMEMCGHRQYLGPPAEVPADVSGSLINLRKRIITFSSCQDNVLASDKLPPTYADFPETIKSRDFQPLPREGYAADNTNASYATMTATELEDEPTAKSRFRHDLWSIVHRMQGFETRFGLKTALVTSLLAIPAWFIQDAAWWNEFEIWTGGNVQDLFTRALCAILGALWGGLSFAAGNGNPYVIAVFSVIFMLPMIYRFTQSTHPVNCEQFFEYVVALRQSSLFYHPHFVRDNAEAVAELLGHRRDAIATILTNLYVLSGALRADRKVPKYLPSAAATRKRLLDRTKQLEAELAASGKLTASEKTESKKWAQIYSYSYNESLTGCVEQLLELERYTKAIVGEQGYMRSTWDRDGADAVAKDWVFNKSIPSGVVMGHQGARSYNIYSHQSPGGLTTKSNYGLIDRSYPTDGEFDPNGEKTLWQRFEYYVNWLNQGADKNTQYKVLLMGRHGEGYHNAAESYFGTPAWNCYWGPLDGNGTHIWRDADLTESGIEQTVKAFNFWANQLAVEKQHAPQSYYTSPMTRCTVTANLTFNGLDLPEEYPFVPTVKEYLREGISMRTCDERSSKTYIQSRFPWYRFEEGFTENDELWKGYEGETSEAQFKRANELVDDIVSTDDNIWLSITSHSGQIRTILEVLNHRPFRLSTGQAIAVLVKAEMRNIEAPTSTIQSWQAEATCNSPPVTSIPGTGCVCSSAYSTLASATAVITPF